MHRRPRMQLHLGSLIDDGSCDYCSCALDGDGGQNGFGLAVEEHAVGGIAGMTTYRLYVTTPGPTDFVSAVAGDEFNPHTCVRARASTRTNTAE